MLARLLQSRQEVGGALAIFMVVPTLTVRLPQSLAEGRDVLGLTGFWDLDSALAGIGLALALVGPGAHALETERLRREIRRRSMDVTGQGSTSATEWITSRGSGTCLRPVRTTRRSRRR